MNREERQATICALFTGRFDVVKCEDSLANGGPLIAIDRHLELARALRGIGYKLYLYIAATHYLANPKKDETEHYELAYGLRTVGRDSHIAQWRVRVEMDEEIDTMVHLFAGADWQEREQYDLVGVRFKNHPDLRRLMMPDDWVGHPLRKDFAIDRGLAPWR